MAITKGVKGSGNNPTTAVTVTATLTGSSTAGSTWLVGITCRNATTTITSITDNSSGGPMTYSQIGTYVNGVTNIRTSLWATAAGAGKVSATTITATTSVAERDTVILATEWFGVAAIGTNGNDNNTTADPTIALTTQDANNFVVAMFGARGVTLPTSKTGTLDVVLASEGTSQVSGGMVSNTAASASSVTCAETLAAATWTALAVELRSVAATPSRGMTMLGVG
jgi:hypothetical protein